MPAELTPKQQFVELVKQAQSILLLTHAYPDGDALGSTLALAAALQKLDKTVTITIDGEIPDTFAFLPGFESIQRELTITKDLLMLIDESQAQVGNVSLKRISETKLMVVITPKNGTLTPANVRVEDGSFQTDLIIALDCAAVERIGALYEENPSLFFEVPVINIDHHATNTNFGKVNIVDVTASSTCEILVGLLEALGKDMQGFIDADMATNLLTGITTDTGSFQNAATTPKSLTVAAQMVAAGGRQQEIIKRVFKTRSLAQLRLWGRVLSYMKEDSNFRFAWSALSRADFVAAQAIPGEDNGGVIDELMKTAEGMDFVLLMYERDGGVKGSFRATLPHVDVSRLAGLFDGGGHTQAAGFFIPNSTVADQEQIILAKVREHLASQTPAAIGSDLADLPEVQAAAPLELPEESEVPQPKKPRLPRN